MYAVRLSAPVPSRDPAMEHYVVLTVCEGNKHMDHLLESTWDGEAVQHIQGSPPEFQVNNDSTKHYGEFHAIQVESIASGHKQ